MIGADQLFHVGFGQMLRFRAQSNHMAIFFMRQLRQRIARLCALCCNRCCSYHLAESTR